jgi:hypothetical protein
MKTLKVPTTILTLGLFVAMLGSAVAQVELFVYDNTTTPGQPFLNGGAALQGANTITRLVADDITPIGGYAGMAISNIYFSVYNNNAAAVSARPRIRFYGSDGAGGGPGTFLTGYTFNPISFSTGGSYWYFHPTGMNVPAGTFWAGMTFDNNSGGTGATSTDLDNLGMVLFNPPTVGTSADTYFITTAAGSFLVNNPAGTLGNFGGTPPANFFFGMSVQFIPEPSSLALLALGGIAGLAMLRRRTRS